MVDHTLGVESDVKSYCRDCDEILEKAQGSIIESVTGKKFIDFFSGAGSLNYGHNHPRIKKSIEGYILGDGITNSLDFYSKAKIDFINKFNEVILRPRGLSYKIQFTGPTGANAVEAALKLARKYTKRSSVAAFTSAFHGVSLGALAVTANSDKRKASGVSLGNVIRLPYEKFFGGDIDTAELIEQMLSKPGSGFDEPAAFIVEVVQGEGGVNCASGEWLRKISKICRRVGALLIVDDIQAGCGRCGSFFSFEGLGVEPDIICLSKSIGGYGLPMSIVLLSKNIDVWEPGEHNGTFRGGNLSFVAASAALEFWGPGEGFELRILEKSSILQEYLNGIFSNVPGVQIKGRGLFLGIRFPDQNFARRLAKQCIYNGLLVETCGPLSETLKLMPPLTIDLPDMAQGIEILSKSFSEIYNFSSGSFCEAC